MKFFSKSEIFEQVRQFLKDNPNGVIEIFGPTASGKTSFSIDLSNKIDHEFEVISVDSRQVYKECDVSSAKITKEEMEGVPHWGLDLVDLTEAYSVYDFQQYAFRMIDEIQGRGGTPILCGGTMLWLDAVSENYVFGENEIEDKNSPVTEYEKSKKKADPRWPVFKIGLHWDRKKLYERINYRAQLHFEGGLIEETKNILSKYSLTDGNWCECKFDNRVFRIPNDPSKKKMARNVSSSFGYAEIAAYLEGLVTYEEALDLNRKRNRNYAKRQSTWWNGREDVVWMDMTND